MNLMKFLVLESMISTSIVQDFLTLFLSKVLITVLYRVPSCSNRVLEVIFGKIVFPLVLS